jgi:hypothetical protein
MVGSETKEIHMITRQFISKSFIVATLISPLVLAQATPPAATQKNLQPGDVATILLQIKQTTIPTIPAADYVVTGNQKFDGWFLKANHLIFKKNATLVFSRTSLQSRRLFYIVAQEVDMEDNSAPGTIAWEQPPTSTAPASSGQAATGAYPSGAGHPGDIGNPGPTGESAPTLYFTVLTIPGSGPKIDFRGQAGGIGGQGQKGGSGAAGGGGASAAQNLFNCMHGAGNGGDGGQGGPGGPGGNPGAGGNGGAVTILSGANLLPALTSRVRVLISGGVAGQPGSGGPGGDGGPGGPGGAQQLPYCQGNGANGRAGGPGTQGPAGQADNGALKGTDGDVLVGAITPADFTNFVYGGGQQ